MNARSNVMVLAAVVGALLAACRDRPEAVAAEMPRLEIKAEVAKPHTATVVAPYDGRIDAIRFAEGATVRAGDVVVLLKNPTVERDLAYSRAQLRIAEYRLRQAGAPQRSGSTNDTDGDERLRASEEIAQSRKARLDRYEALYKSRDITADALENARLEYAVAIRDLKAEQSARRNARESAQLAPPADPALLRLDLERARAEVAVVEDRQRQLQVTAPIGGAITRILANPGESIFPRDPLFEVSDTTTLEVRGGIAPELLRHVRVGMMVDVKIFTVPPRRFRAAIRKVIPATDPAGAAIVVPVPNPDGVLQPGTPATIEVR